MPSIYVAPLSDYNNGILHGVWIDFDKCNDALDVWQAVNTMLAASPSANIYIYIYITILQKSMPYMTMKDGLSSTFVNMKVFPACGLYIPCCGMK